MDLEEVGGLSGTLDSLKDMLTKRCVSQVGISVTHHLPRRVGALQQKSAMKLLCTLCDKGRSTIRKVDYLLPEI